ncbi:PREDICTED: uncharacterized protein LOC105557981 isoform X2 [Vollenhovia emeryi]|uniref:uncharacterized protein LOC105557981 isoform X2 n=1 Tax=Vollenhovia emeryi TaxID=411798 RepID=UPI0005F3FDFE|nr:PREDICTED: uncharacterized protein LOC105557981 isoform X2 [Vollenhovia emeryi]
MGKLKVYSRPKSKKKGWVLRRRLLKLAQMQIDRDTMNESSSPQSSVGFRPNETNSENSTGNEITHCLSLMKSHVADLKIKEEVIIKEEADSNEEKKDFVFVNVANIAETEDYKEEGILNHSIESSDEERVIPDTMNNIADNNCSINAFNIQENILAGNEDNVINVNNGETQHSHNCCGTYCITYLTL